MFHQPTHNYSTTAILLILVVITLFSRMHTYYEPVESDIATYAVIGHEILQGRELYSDLWDLKPPLVYLTFAATEWVAGYGLLSLYLLNVTAVILTLLGLYQAGNVVHKRAGLWAATAWTIVSSDLFLKANQPTIELLLNTCLIWTFTLFITQTLKPSKSVLIGIILAVASLYKPNMVVAAALFSMAYLISPPLLCKRWQALMQVMIMAIVGLIAWGLVIGYFLWVGRFEAFYETVFVWARAYVDIPTTNPKWLFPVFSPITLPLGLLSLVGLCIGLLKFQRHWGFLFAYAIAVFIMIALPNKFFPYYYQLWLPLLCLAAGWTLVECSILCKQYFTRMSKFSEEIAGTVFIIILLLLQLPFYRLSPQEWSYKKHENIRFIFNEQLAGEINKLLQPGETFYQWGYDTSLFFYTQRPPPSGVFLFQPLLMGPAIFKLSVRTIVDLERNRPELVILPQAGGEPMPPQHPVIRWIMANYAPHPDNAKRNYVDFYVLKGGRLEKRYRPQ